MSPAAIFVSGWFAGVLTVVVLAIVGMCWTGDRPEHANDDFSDHLGIGGGADHFQHGEPSK